MEATTSNDTVETQLTTINVEQDSADIEIITSDEQTLIDETFLEIVREFNETANNLYLKVGNIILEKIFEGNIAQAKEINDVKVKGSRKAIFQGVIQKLHEMSGDGRAPKKTWLYNAVNLAIAEQNCATLPGYKELPSSHKIELLQAEDDQKEALIKQIQDDGLSVRATRKLVRGEKEQGPQKVPSLRSYIQKPVAGFTAKDLKYVGGKGGQKALAELAKVRTNLEAHLKELEEIEKLLKEKQKNK